MASQLVALLAAWAVTVGLLSFVFCLSWSACAFPTTTVGSMAASQIKEIFLNMQNMSIAIGLGLTSAVQLMDFGVGVKPQFTEFIQYTCIMRIAFNFGSMCIAIGLGSMATH